MNRTYFYRLCLHSFHKFASIRVIGGFQFSFLAANYANKRQSCHYDFCRLTAAATKMRRPEMAAVLFYVAAGVSRRIFIH